MDQQVKTEMQEPRAYEQPTITDHGTLAEVTAGPWGGGIDGLIGINNGQGGFNPGLSPS
jgi:hypothetical protein